MSGFEGFPPPQGSGGGGYGMGDDPTFGDVTADSLSGPSDQNFAVYGGTSRALFLGGNQATALTLGSSGIATFASVLDIPSNIRHDGDTDTLIGFTDDAITLQAGGVAMLTLAEDTTNTATLADSVNFGWGDTVLRRSAASTLTVDADGAGAAATLAVATGNIANVNATGGTLTLQTAGGNRANLNASNFGLNVSMLHGASATGGLGFANAAGVAAGVTLTESSATRIANWTMGGADNMASCLAVVTVYAADATDKQIRHDLVAITIQNDGGTITGTATSINSQAETTTGTLSASYAIADAGSNVANLTCNAVSSLTQSTLLAHVYLIGSTRTNNMGATTGVPAVN